MDRTANKDSRWRNYCNKIIVLIDNDGDDFPAEDDINKLVRQTELAFRDTPFMQYAMDKVFDIRRRWRAQDGRRKRREKEEQLAMEDKLELSEDVAASIKEVVTKIAVHNKIAMADKVTINLNEGGGTIKFKGIEDTNEG